LEVGADGKILNYHLRLKDQKRLSVEKLKELNFKVVAAGDSYNDIGMLQAANRGILFMPPENVVREFPQFPVTQTYAELQAAFEKAKVDLK
jgi:phosphoserine/homoserine phosphotransferase